LRQTRRNKELSEKIRRARVIDSKPCEKDFG
jgi:hypothetical protein